MSESVINEATSAESEKPVPHIDEIKFPPFPDTTDTDFEEDICEEERNFYKTKFKDLNDIKTAKLHCTACDRHLGCSARNESRMRAHPMLRTLVCHTCHTFYNSGEFEKGDDGSELYCRWCGQGGQVYCCSDCPHVFCARCIKRNLGTPKIKEIENTDDWKCFKCNNKPLWDLRAICWALLRYCDLKNKITYKTQDPELKEAYQKDCALDQSECCKHKNKKKLELSKKKDDNKKEENAAKKAAATAISKIPPTIQVKKFASINLDEATKQEKKAIKRPASPKNKILFKNSFTLSTAPRLLNPLSVPSYPKKIRMPNSPIGTQIRFGNERKPATTYARIRPKPPQLPIPVITNQYNGFNNSGGFNNAGFNNSSGFNNMLINDNINLSIESLTQGLDMNAVAAMANSSQPQDDDVVCTPDFPLEPLCEVTEDNNDDDVQCITPGPVAAPKLNTPPPLVPRLGATLPDLTPENIIQMTEHDVTVNAATGGLKFRVDPQTLSSNKMYRLPDGRIFAINANPNMPGGYSATIVAVTEASAGKNPPKGATYAAKLSTVSTTPVQPPPLVKSSRNQTPRISNSKRSTPRTDKVTRGTDTSSRECDLNVPVEWYRYNLIDAVDALEYSLSRLNKLKKEATTMFLRTRSVGEMRSLHRTLERLLNTSTSRFNEVRDNLNKGLKQYLIKKKGGTVSEDDDDVEILPDLDDNDDPIYIDENSMESNTNDTNCSENQEVDLTGLTNSEPNDSGEKLFESKDTTLKTEERDPLSVTENDENNMMTDSNSVNDVSMKDNDNEQNINKIEDNNTKENDGKQEKNVAKDNDKEVDENPVSDSESGKTNLNCDEQVIEEQGKKVEEDKITNNEAEILKNTEDNQEGEEKLMDSEMSEEMIETLLKDDGADDGDNMHNANCIDDAEIV